jgi:hypothetical protein
MGWFHAMRGGGSNPPAAGGPGAAALVSPYKSTRPARALPMVSRPYVVDPVLRSHLPRPKSADWRNSPSMRAGFGPQ